MLQVVDNKKSVHLSPIFVLLQYTTCRQQGAEDVGCSFVHLFICSFAVWYISTTGGGGCWVFICSFVLLFFCSFVLLQYTARNNKGRMMLGVYLFICSFVHLFFYSIQYFMSMTTSCQRQILGVLLFPGSIRQPVGWSVDKVFLKIGELRLLASW